MPTKEQIVARANENLAIMGATTGPVKQIIAEHDLVFGIFQESTCPDGVGAWIIKGRRRLESIVSSGEAEPLKWSAIPCTSLEHAVAVQRVLGGA